MADEQFSEEQRQYLQGFVAGGGIARAVAGLPSLAGNGIPAAPGPASDPDAIHDRARRRIVAEGGKLTPEEASKAKVNPLDRWDDLRDAARDARFPKGADVLHWKFHGLFYVAPAQDSYMCRLRFHGGIVRADQFRALGHIAEHFAGGYADITTRANLQLREIRAADGVHALEALHDAGIVTRGSGADNIRNVTGSPTAGIDPNELIDTRPLTREMHQYILNHREMYGLPRKFNIAFDGGGSAAVLEDTNDIGFSAVRVGDGRSVPPGVYFRVLVGGITGHLDFARDTGLLLKPEECVPFAAALIRVFIEHGDRTDRKKARLKYLIDQWGFEKLLDETAKAAGWKGHRLPLSECEPRGPIDPRAHVGVHPQRQKGLFYVGIVAPVGRLTAHQLCGLAQVADAFGSGVIRLTVWQNLIVSDIAGEDLDAAKRAIQSLGLDWNPSPIRAGLVACTGSAGCKFAAADTKRHALQIAERLEARVQIDVPINMHLTGCHHSCAQHYIGDLGFLATKIERGDDLIEAYHVYVGGGAGATQGIARELARDVPAEELPEFTERILTEYLSHRIDAEPFVEFARRHWIASPSSQRTLGSSGSSTLLFPEEKAHVVAASA